MALIILPIKPHSPLIQWGGVIEFYDNNSAVNQAGVFPVKRDDIASKATVYVFGFSGDKPSTHGVGLEVYNSDGKVIYNSSNQYLDVLACGSDTGGSVLLSGTTIVFALGNDAYTFIEVEHKLGARGVDYQQFPKFTITDGKVNVGMLRATVTYIAQGGEDDTHGGWHVDRDSRHYDYGWLIGKV